VADGVRLLLQACRDSTGGGTLTYDGTRETDLVVQRGGVTVWSWGRTHPDSPAPHQRAASAAQCWNWQLVWPDVRQSGAAAGHGEFTLVATTSAHELAGYPPQSVRFSY
jgi:hypothetical protein